MITDAQILDFINKDSFKNIKDVSPKLKEIIIEILTNKNK
jgi:hypothetical protein